MPAARGAARDASWCPVAHRAAMESPAESTAARDVRRPAIAAVGREPRKPRAPGFESASGERDAVSTEAVARRAARAGAAERLAASPRAAAKPKGAASRPARREQRRGCAQGLTTVPRRADVQMNPPRTGEGESLRERRPAAGA